MDIESLRIHLEYDKRWRPMYTDAFQNLFKELHAEPYVSEKALRDDFLKTFHKWIHGSSLNRIRGLEGFPDRDVIVGVTHALDDLHLVFKNQIVVLDKEYSYNQKINPYARVKTIDHMASGDPLILSYPFSDTGRKPLDFEELIKRAERIGFDVHIDAAWYGCTRGLDMDFSSPAIKSVSFSLSKALGMGKHRIGVRYTRNRWPGPVSVCNDYGYVHDSLMWLGIKFIERFGCDFLQTQFYDTYRKVCTHFQFQETNMIYLAEDASHSPHKRVGLRSILRYLHENRL